MNNHNQIVGLTQKFFVVENYSRIFQSYKNNAKIITNYNMVWHILFLKSPINLI